MNATMQWLIPDRVLYWKLSGNLTIEDFCEGLDEINLILEDANHKVHVIVNARQARSLQGDPKNVRQLARSAARHSYMGCFIVISHNFLFKHHLNRVTLDFGTQLRYSDSFRNSWYSLHNIDSSLPYVAPQQPKFTKKARHYV